MARNAAPLLRSVPAAAFAALAMLSWFQQHRGGDRVALALDSSTTGDQTALVPLTERVERAGLTDAERVRMQERIAAAPLVGMPYYLLGLDAAHRGDPAKASALVGVALRYDPRLLPAYLWQARTKARRGDVAAATRSLLQLVGVDPQNASALSALAQLSVSPVARRIIVAELVRNPDWRGSYVSALNNAKVAPGAIYHVLNLADPLGSRQTATRRAFLDAQVSQGKFENAYVAWVGWLPNSALDGFRYVYDPTFKGMPGMPPFNWDFSDLSYAAAEPSAEGLSVTLDGTQAATLASQLLLLAPGRYTLAGRIGPASIPPGADQASLRWRLVCASGGEISTLSLPLRAGSGSAVRSAPFTVADGCAAQWLSLEAPIAAVPGQMQTVVPAISIERVR